MCAFLLRSLASASGLTIAFSPAFQYNLSGCSQQYPACSYQVGYNGSSFNEAYWDVQELRVYASGGDTDNAANSPNTHAENAALLGMTSLPVHVAGLVGAAVGGALVPLL